MPKYTFLLPAYKARFMREALRSILAQTYTDFCVLVSDDCSPEDLKSIVDEFAGDPRVTYRRNERNMGSQSLVSHWNLLVDMCQTEWLIMASDDDVYDPRFLEEVDALQGKYPQVDVIRGRVRCIEKNLEVYAVDQPYDEFVCQEQYVYDHFISQRNRCMANYAFRTTVLKKISGFTEYPLAWYSDDMTVFRMANNGIAITANVVFSYRSSELCISGMARSVKQNRAWIESSVQYDKDVTKMVDSFCEERQSLLLKQKRDLWRNEHIKMMRGILISYNYVLTLREMWILYCYYKPLYLTTKYQKYWYLLNWLKYTIRHGFIIKSRTV